MFGAYGRGGTEGRSSTRRARILTCVLVCLGTVMYGAGAADAATREAQPAPGGSIGIRLVGVPARNADEPRAAIYVVDRIAPGAAVQRRIEISNSVATSEHVVLYTAAASIAHGTFAIAAGHTQNDASSWTSVVPGAVDVPGAGTATAVVTITVPDDAAPGEHYGVVWAEVRSAPKGSGGVVQVNRVGIRLYLSIGEGGPPPSDFTITGVTTSRSRSGDPVVIATVHNTGGRALDLSGSLRLTAGPGDLRAGPFPATLGTTLGIDDTEPVTIVLDSQVPAGPWTTRITLRSGLIERSNVSRITFPKGVAAATGSDTTGRTTLAAVLAALVLLLVMVAVAVVLRRRLRERSTASAAPVRS